MRGSACTPALPRPRGGGRLARWRLLPPVLLLALALWQFGEAGWLAGKAWLAQVLIGRAWAEAVETGAAAPPWPWADTRPVARLVIPALGIDEIVLAGASGRTLAFGPGHAEGTAPPGAPGVSLISGHRDTHFRFLADLVPGTEIRLQTPDGQWHGFRSGAGEIVDSRTTRIAVIRTGMPRLLLSTCYPFDAVVRGGPLRYVVVAEAEDINRGPSVP
jgi:sortase A